MDCSGTSADVARVLCPEKDCISNAARIQLDALDREICCLKSRIRCLEDRIEAMQTDVCSYRGHMLKQASVNDCFRKELGDLKRCNTALKWKKGDLEKEIHQLCSAAECLRQRLSLLACR